jgi:hypothetical protein
MSNMKREGVLSVSAELENTNCERGNEARHE